MVCLKEIVNLFTEDMLRIISYDNKLISEEKTLNGYGEWRNWLNKYGDLVIKEITINNETKTIDIRVNAYENELQ